MADNSIERVRTAETTAEQLLRSAAQKAGEIAEDAQSKAAQLSQDAQDGAQAKAAEQVAAAQEQNQGILKDALAELSGELTQLEQKAHASQDKAVQMILQALA